ncbi:MAG: PAS domain S-box protein [Desulfobacterales bacterium]|nr:PAS domain S-box protein [Desulfobacterales bacterium]
MDDKRTDGKNLNREPHNPAGTENECHPGKFEKEQLHTILDALPDPVLFFTLDNTVEYINPAFETLFGWNLDEVRGKNIPFIPNRLVEQARQGLKVLFKHRSVHDFETRRFAKDGRTLDVRLNASLITAPDNTPLGHVMILRDITGEKKTENAKQAMFRISQALHTYQELGELIGMINYEIKELLDVEGSFILLEDEETGQLFFYEAIFRNEESDRKFKKIRFRADQGVSGRVFKTGTPMMIPDVAACDFFLRRVDDETELDTRNMMSVPIRLKDRTIGVVSVVNKSNGEFQTEDMELLATVAATIALPIENARIHGELRRSFSEVKALNHAKDKVINHLAHEMKTPVAVLGASMKLMVRKVRALGADHSAFEKIIARARRNLNRLLDIQYETEDLLTKKDYTAHHLLSRLADACRDEMEVLLETEIPEGISGQGTGRAMERIQQVLDDFFGPRHALVRPVALHSFIEEKIRGLRGQFRERTCDLISDIRNVGEVMIPVEILDAVVTGLIRNSVEYTPDRGRIAISLSYRDAYPELLIQDHGIGFTKDKILLVFENYFTPPDTPMYATKTPFEFNAGGSGLDLLRMRIFSEKYNFRLDIDSRRCKYIPTEQDLCPGDIDKCRFCSAPRDCFDSGGTSVRVRFPEVRGKTEPEE